MPRLIRWFFPERIWAFPTHTKTVYLTFDDGPVPQVTPWVLDELKKHNAQATFFCIGDNISKNPEIFQRMIAEGHSVGNHTFNHLNGWKTKTSKYIENVEKAREQMLEVGRWKLEDKRLTASGRNISKYSELFRPPYGKITSKQAKILQKKGFKIVMWDVLSYDFNASVSEEKCLQNVLKNIKPGSIVVFHDSLKAEKNLRYVLPKVLEYCFSKNWEIYSI